MWIFPGVYHAFFFWIWLFFSYIVCYCQLAEFWLCDSAGYFVFILVVYRLGADGAWLSFGILFYGSSGIWEAVSCSLESLRTFEDPLIVLYPFLGGGFRIGVPPHLVYSMNDRLLTIFLRDSYVLFRFFFVSSSTFVFGLRTAVPPFLYFYINIYICSSITKKKYLCITVWWCIL